jgi:hypothetical protein
MVYLAMHPVRAQERARNDPRIPLVMSASHGFNLSTAGLLKVEVSIASFPGKWRPVMEVRA